MCYFAYDVGGWVQKEGKMCLRDKSMAPNGTKTFHVITENKSHNED